MNFKPRLLVVAGVAMLALVPAFAQESKQETAPSAGFDFVRGVGDAFGYSINDSSGPLCNYDFIDISATGTSVASGDDSASAPLNLAAPFNLYGTDYTQLVMTTNGALSTDLSDTGGDLSNDCPLPATPSTSGGARIYPMHDDIVTTDGFFQYFTSCPRPSDQFPSLDLGCNVFQWSGVTHFGGGGPWEFQAILYEGSFEIVFQHGVGNPEAGSGSTTGIQNDGATDGSTYACDTAASVADNTAQCFAHPAPIVSAAPPVSVPTGNRWGILMMLAAFALLAFGQLRARP
jgi:hypothetical protein